MSRDLRLACQGHAPGCCRRAPLWNLASILREGYILLWGFPIPGILMSNQAKTYLKFGGATAVILLLLAYLAYTGVQDSKSYYVTIKELHKMGDRAYTKRLRVAGNVQPGSIKRTGTHVQFVLVEEDQNVSVDYTGTEAPPDTFKDDSQALADGSFGRDGVFHAKQLQAKCASKYAPQPPGTPGAAPQAAPAKTMT